MRFYFLFSALLGFFPFLILGQNTLQDSLAGEAFLDSSIVFKKKGDFKKAFKFIEKSYWYFEKSGITDRILKTQIETTQLLLKLHEQPFIAQVYIDSCINLAELSSRTYGKKELDYFCRLYLIQAHVGKRKFLENFYYVKNALLKAYKIFSLHLKEKKDIANYLYYQLGNTYVRLGEFQSAEKIFKEAYQYSLTYNAPEVAKFNDFAGLYMQLKDFDKANEIFQKGLSTQGLPAKDFMFTRLGYVDYLIQTGKIAEALDLNRQLVSLLQSPPYSTHDALPEFQFNIFENFAQAFFTKKQCDSTVFWYQKAIEIELNYSEGTQRQIAFFYNEIGNTYLACNNPTEALTAFHSALQTMIPGFTAPPNVNPDPSSFTAENVIYKALQGKALCFEKLGQPDLALECYELIPIVEAKLRRTHEYESSSLQALEFSRARLDKAVGLAWQLYDKTRDLRYAERAFLLSEQGRGVLLLQSLSKNKAASNLPDSIQARFDALHTRIAWYERAIAEEKAKNDPSNHLREFDTALFRHKQELSLLEADLSAKGLLDDQTTYLDARAVPALVHPGNLLLSYYFVDSALYVFSFSSTAFLGWRRLDIPPGWKENAVQLADFFTRREESTAKQKWFSELAARLYNNLLGPELKKYPQTTGLTILPDQVLTGIPFEALLTKAAPPGPWATLPYLVRHYAVSYAYSATLLGTQKSIRHSDNSRKTLAAFAPLYPQIATDPVSGFRLVNLPQIRAAAALATQKFGGDFFDTLSSESLFQTNANRYRVLLFGMHGFADPDNPALSRLAVGPPIAKGEPDNLLFAPELQTMHLQADLAVLLACHTGSGKWRKGEGVYNIARTFALAGVPCVVTSLWSLPDLSAGPLSNVFFERYFAQSQPTDKALQQAKIMYLDNPDFFELAHPFFWAGLMATGDMR